GVVIGTAPASARRLERWSFAVFWAAVLALTVRAWTLGAVRPPLERFPLAIGLVSRHELRIEDPLYRASWVTNLFTTERDRILFYGEVRGQFIERDYAWGDPTAQPFIDYGRLRDPAALAARLRELGYRHGP